MKNTTSLCFSKNGVLNPEAMTFFVDKKLSKLALFGDGTREAYDHMCNYDWSDIDHPSLLACVRTPRYDLRVIGPDGELSNPNYVYSEKDLNDWFLSNICATCITINVSDTTSQSDTKVELTKDKTILICEMAYRFWNILKTAESHLCFPASAIDALTRWSRDFNKQSIDIAALRSDTGITSLDYNSLTDTLSLELIGETFAVKLSVLDDFLKDIVLPFFDRYKGREYRLEVLVKGITDPNKPQTVSYGELGQIIEQLRSFIVVKPIDQQHPFDIDDLKEFSRRLWVNEESCVFPENDEAITAFFDRARDVMCHDDGSPNDKSDPVHTTVFRNAA